MPWVFLVNHWTWDPPTHFVAPGIRLVHDAEVLFINVHYLNLTFPCLSSLCLVEWEFSTRFQLLISQQISISYTLHTHRNAFLQISSIETQQCLCLIQEKWLKCTQDYLPGTMWIMSSESIFIYTKHYFISFLSTIFFSICYFLYTSL